MTPTAIPMYWNLQVGPGRREGRAGVLRAEAAAIAYGVRVALPLSSTVAEWQSMGELVNLSLTINARDFLKMPLMYLPHAGVPMFGTTFVSAHMNPGGTHALHLSPGDAVEMWATYDPDAWVRGQDDDRPPPLPLTRPVTFAAILDCEVPAPDAPERTTP